MCGIFGYATVDRGAGDTKILRVACTAMRHRGPDAEGVWHDDYCGLGHRRLSIIDLESGQQPMSYADRYTIAFNGEIYNYRQLRLELATRGHVFRTTSDTEVVLAACAEWGVEAPARLRGIFAFGLWDRRERSLLLARDHFGVKPLVFDARADRIVFSSELKGLLAACDTREIDPQALSDYLALGYVLGSKTILRGVQRLDPGTTVVWKQGVASVRRYWDLSQALQPDADDAPASSDPVAEYAARLEDAVTIQMVSDVPVGAFLSGGLDSSSVAYFMRGATRLPLQTFSMGFRERSFSELPQAGGAAAALGTEHHAEEVTENLADRLPALVRAFDEPLGDTSIVPTYYVSRLASRHVKVVLSGDGADETLAGYDTYVADLLQRGYRRIPRVVHRSLLAPLAGLIPDSRRKVSLNYRAKQFIAQAHGDWRRAHYGWRLLSPDALRVALLGGAAPGHDPFDQYRAYFEQVNGCGELSQALYVDIKTWLANDILVKVDRASMSVGLEARVPFLDPELVTFTMRLPRALKMKGLERKVILRRAMRGRLPDTILARRKRGFNAPVTDWLRGGLRSMMEDLLATPSTIVDVHHPAVRATWKAHVSGAADHGFRLWALMSLLLWERGVLHGSVPEPTTRTATI